MEWVTAAGMAAQAYGAARLRGPPFFSSPFDPSAQIRSDVGLPSPDLTKDIYHTWYFA